MMNSVITILYFNERVYEENDGVIFEDSKKAIEIKHEISFNALEKKIGDKVKLENNEIISVISCRFLVSGKYVALHICDDRDVKTTNMWPSDLFSIMGAILFGAKVVHRSHAHICIKMFNLIILP